MYTWTCFIANGRWFNCCGTTSSSILDVIPGMVPVNSVDMPKYKSCASYLVHWHRPWDLRVQSKYEALDFVLFWFFILVLDFPLLGSLAPSHVFELALLDVPYILSFCIWFMCPTHRPILFPCLWYTDEEVVCRVQRQGSRSLWRVGRLTGTSSRETTTKGTRAKRRRKLGTWSTCIGREEEQPDEDHRDLHLAHRDRDCVVSDNSLDV